MVKRLVNVALSDPSINISEEELLNRIIYQDAYRVPSLEEMRQAIMDLRHAECSIEQLIRQELTIQSLSWSSEDTFGYFVPPIRKMIIGNPTAELIHQAVILYLTQLAPETICSQTNALYCGDNCWLTQDGYNLVKDFAYQTHQPMSSVTTQLPLSINLPVRSIHAVLQLKNPAYDIDALPLHDPALHTDEFVVNKDELLLIVHHLCTQRELAALIDEEVECLRNKTHAQMYTLRALVELLQQKIRTQHAHTQEKSSVAFVPAEEVILMLHQEGSFTIEQAMRILPLLGNQQRISLERVQGLIRKRLEIMGEDN